MSELLVFVTSDAARGDLTYQDGDIVHAWSRREILATHANNITTPKAGGFTRDGLRPGGLRQQVRELVCTVKVQRVSRTEVLRTDLVTLDARTVGPTPNAHGERINVEASLAHRLKNPKHQVFGTPGAEVWYGGNQRWSDPAVVTAVWGLITAQLGVTPADGYQRAHLSDTERRHFLPVPVDPLVFAEPYNRRAMAREVDYDRFQPEYDPENGVGDMVVRKRRVSLAGWRDMPRVNIANALNPDVIFDLRSGGNIEFRDYVTVKARKNVWTESGQEDDGGVKTGTFPRKAP